MNRRKFVLSATATSLAASLPLPATAAQLTYYGVPMVPDVITDSVSWAASYEEIVTSLLPDLAKLQRKEYS